MSYLARAPETPADSWVIKILGMSFCSNKASWEWTLKWLLGGDWSPERSTRPQKALAPTSLREKTKGPIVSQWSYLCKWSLHKISNSVGIGELPYGWPHSHTSRGDTSLAPCVRPRSSCTWGPPRPLACVSLHLTLCSLSYPFISWQRWVFPWVLWATPHQIIQIQWGGGYGNLNL